MLEEDLSAQNASLFIVAGLYVPGDWSWRFSSLLQALGPLMMLPILWFCPESPRVRSLPNSGVGVMYPLNSFLFIHSG